MRQRSVHPWLWCLAILPAIGPLIVFWRFHVDIAWNDAWNLADLLVKSHLGTLRFSDFWVPHNEHRMPIPYMIMYVLARLTRWNTYAEVFFGYAMVCLLSFLFLKLLQTVADELGASTRIWLWFMINLLIFSPMQCENWMFGFSAVQNFIPIPCILGAILLLYRKGLTWPALLISGLLIEIASLSLANGLLGWGLIVPVILLSNGNKKPFLIAWSAMMVLSLVIQFWGYGSNPATGLYYGASIWKKVEFFLAFLGSMLNFENPAWPSVTVAIGVAVALSYVLVFVWFLGTWISSDIQGARRMLPWVLLGAYGLAGALLGAVGRAGLGVDQAVTSRYTTIAMMVVICLLGVLYLPPTPSARRTRLQSIQLYLRWTFVAFLLGGVALSTWRTPIQYHRRMALFRKAASYVAFSSLISEPRGQILAGQLSDLGERAEALEQAGYLQTRLIRNSDISALMPKGADDPTQLGTHGQISGANSGAEGYVDVWGWAALRSERRGADAVLLTFDDENNVPRLCAIRDVEFWIDLVGEALGSDFTLSGWAIRLPLNRLPQGTHRLRCWAYDSVHQVAYPLGGQVVEITR